MKHKINIYALIITLLIIAKSGWSQNTNLDYKYAFKVYNLTTYERLINSEWFIYTPSYHYQNTYLTLQILHPTIAFQWKSNKNNFHEIEITTLMLNKHGSKNEIIYNSTFDRQKFNKKNLTSTDISIRYEYILNLNKSKESKFVPSIGFGFIPYYKRDFYNSKIPNSFSISDKYYGIRTFITPRLTYYLNTKIFIDVNIPFCIYDSYYNLKNEINQ